jgi:hypothetical protein
MGPSTFNSRGENADRRSVAQISRPFQIALAAVAMLGLVWAVALRGHAAAQHESTGSAPASPAPSAQAEARAAARPTPIYHGAAPGVEGLTRAIAKAHGAVATSQRNSRELERHSREASGETRAAGAGNATHARATASGAAHGRPATHARRTTAGAHRGAASHGASGKHGTEGRPAVQVAVEHEVVQGKTVLLLLWNSKSSVDREVRAQTQAMVASAKGRLALHVAAPSQVGEFGSVTEIVHVYQTPTILIVNRRGVVSTLTGLTDTFALKQLVHEAQRANR